MSSTTVGVQAFYITGRLPEIQFGPLRLRCFHLTMATTKQSNDSGSIFSADLSLSYKAPNTPFKRFIWRWRMLFESTFALSMFEGWEKVLIGMCCPQTLLESFNLTGGQ